jgi:hypothetical protein
MEQGSPWTIGTGCGAGRSLAALPVAACRGGGRGGPSREDRRSDELGGARRERSGPWRLASRRSPRLGQPSGRGGGRGLERARPLATPGQRAGGGARRAARRAAAPARVCGPLLHSNTAAAVPGPATRAAMVGRLSLQDVPELVDTKKKGDGVLDSPDSGLPPSPSPSHWGLAATAGGGGERAPVAGTLEPDAAVTPIVPVSCLPRGLLPVPAHPQPSPGSLQLSQSVRPPARRDGVAIAGSRGGSVAREPGQLEPVAGKLSSPGRRGSPGRGKPRSPPFEVAAPEAARLRLDHIPAGAGWVGLPGHGQGSRALPTRGAHAPRLCSQSGLPLPGPGRGVCSGLLAQGGPQPLGLVTHKSLQGLVGLFFPASVLHLMRSASSRWPGL